MSVCAEIYFQQTWHAYQTLSQQFNSLQGKIFLCVFCCLITTSPLVLVISYLLVSSAKCCLLSLAVFSSPTLALRVNRSSRPPSMKTIQPPPSHSATLIFIKILIKLSGTLCQTGPFAVRKKGPRWVLRGFGGISCLPLSLYGKRLSSMHRKNFLLWALRVDLLGTLYNELPLGTVGCSLGSVWRIWKLMFLSKAKIYLKFV